jgi:hypothetical protein
MDNNGGIPCYKDGLNITHITISGTKCLCGKTWSYGTIDRTGHSNNILYRNINSVDCQKCKELFGNETKS